MQITVLNIDDLTDDLNALSERDVNRILEIKAL